MPSVMKDRFQKKRKAGKNYWASAVLGFVLGLVPFGLANEISPFAARFLSSPLASSALLDVAFKDPVALQAASGRTGSSEVMNLAQFFARQNTPLEATGQIRSLMPPSFQTNWGPGMDLPYSFSQIMATDLAHIDPSMRVPEGFDPFSRPALSAGYAL